MNESLLKKPAVFPFVECPNCRQLLEYGVESCPRCREEISTEYGLASAIIVHHNTQACSLANSISGGDAFFFLALVGSGLILAIDFYVSGSPTLSWLTPLWSAIPLLVIVVWFIRFGRFSIGDDEYLKARREMRKSLSLWLALFVVQLLVAAVWWLRTPAI
jgi:RNA polymerase subunit RPABC4/transcription elongation factor Spt4